MEWFTFTTTSTSTTPRSRKSCAGLSVSGLIAGDQAGRAAETPLADTPDVYMDEVRARIVAHATAVEGESLLAQLERVDARHAKVDRFRVSVKAILGYSGGASAKGFVRRRRA